MTKGQMVDTADLSPVFADLSPVFTAGLVGTVWLMD